MTKWIFLNVVLYWKYPLIFLSFELNKRSFSSIFFPAKMQLNTWWCNIWIIFDLNISLRTLLHVMQWIIFQCDIKKSFRILLRFSLFLILLIMLQKVFKHANHLFFMIVAIKGDSQIFSVKFHKILFDISEHLSKHADRPRKFCGSGSDCSPCSSFE